MTEPIYRATDAERQLAIEWYDGQSSMLYAIASTGELRHGTIRPTWTRARPFSDVDWTLNLVGRLLREVLPISGDYHETYEADDDDRRVAREWVTKLMAIRDGIERDANDNGTWDHVSDETGDEQ